MHHNQDAHPLYSGSSNEVRALLDFDTACHLIETLPSSIQKDGPNERRVVFNSDTLVLNERDPNGDTVVLAGDYLVFRQL